MQIIRNERALNLPNMLTLMRIALLPAVVWRYQLGDLPGALMVYLAAMVTDLLDGFAARRMNQITALGKLLDPVADKLSTLTLLVLFARDGQISMRLFNLVLLKEIALILGSVAALRVGIVVSALPIGKLTTLMFVFSAVCRFLVLGWLADGLLWLSAVCSLAALAWYGVVLLRKIRAQKTVL